MIKNQFRLVFLCLTLSTVAFGATVGSSIDAHTKKPKPKPTPTPVQPTPVPNSGITPGLYINANGSPLVSMIHSATQSIDIEIYTMYDLNVRNAIRDELAKQIPIRIIQEPAPYGDTCQPFTQASSKDNADCADEKVLVKQVRAAGGTYIPFNKSGLCSDPTNCYLHGKLLVVDQSSALISTGNFDATSLCDLTQSPGHCDRDYSFVDQDADVLTALEKIIDNDVIGKSYDLSAILSGSVGQKLTVSPVSLPSLIQFVQSAKTKLDVANQYLQQADWNSALETAAKSGIQVNVQVSSVCWYGTPSSNSAQSFTSIYTGFDSAGINTSTFTKQIPIDGAPGYLHAKVMVADGNRGWIGSINGSDAATSNNREFGIIFDNPVWVEALDQQIIADHNAAGAETWRQSLSCAKDQ